MLLLLEDERGRLTLRPLRPWHRLMARCLTGRLDRELAGGTHPEATASLAARAMRMTSMEFRRALAVSLRRVIAAAGERRLPRVPVCRERVRRSAPELAELADRLIQPGPVPVRGVAMVTQLLADGGGPLYRPASRDDLPAIIERAGQCLR